MSQNIKQIIQQQYTMCAKDPVFFMRQYCYIQHPKKGKIKFNLYPFQEDSLTELRDNRYNVINGCYKRFSISTGSTANQCQQTYGSN